MMMIRASLVVVTSVLLRACDLTGTLSSGHTAGDSRAMEQAEGDIKHLHDENETLVRILLLSSCDVSFVFIGHL